MTPEQRLQFMNAALAEVGEVPDAKLHGEWPWMTVDHPNEVIWKVYALLTRTEGFPYSCFNCWMDGVRNANGNLHFCTHEYELAI